MTPPRFLVRLTASALLALTVPMQSAQAAGQWTLTNLGDLANGFMGGRGAINSSGQVAGSTVFVPEHAFILDNGVFHDLSNIEGRAAQSYAYGINDAGHVVGGAYLDPFADTSAVLWANGSATRLDSPSDARATAAYGINASGQIVGVGTATGNYGSPREERALLWSGGTAVNLGVLSGGNASRATAINDAGQIVGYSTDNSNITHAVIWNNGQLIDLGVTPGSLNGSQAYDINTRGQVAGVDREQAVIWQNGQRTELGSLPGDVSSTARSINDQGVAVGSSDTVANASNDERAVMWVNGIAVDLNTLEGVEGSGWTLLGAIDINNAGQILGVGVSPHGFYQGFLLSPVPEASTFAMLLLGLTAIGMLARKKGQ